MEFEFTPEQEAFRLEVRGFLQRELPADWEKGFWMQEDTDERWEFAREFHRKVGEKGWLALAWPKEFGGLGATVVEQMIFSEEMAYHGAPSFGFGPLTVAPALMLFGTPEQRQEHLPRIRSAEVYWSQHFSEPEAGSDLAGLQCRATDEGDYFVINGAKIWQHDALHSDWTYLAARTNPDVPKHQGISTFVLDMRTPGITVRPVLTLGHTRNSTTFFDNVRVPRSGLLGEKNKGWYQVAKTLDFERSGIDRTVGNLYTLEVLKQYVRTATRGGKPLGSDPVIRQRIAQLDIEFQVGRLLAYRVAFLQSEGKIPNYEASLSKLWGSELSQRLADAGMMILGMSAQLKRGAKGAPLRGRIERACLISRGDTIRGGTSEIQRVVIATRGLGLPR